MPSFEDDSERERSRLSALRRYDILDTPPEASFDTLTRLAARLFSCSTALVTFIDEDRQWFKARYGLNQIQTHRDIAFCAHTILTHELLVVPDARADPRFAHNPLVTGPPFFRFYAGYPLVTPEKQAIGTFAILDVEPRHNFLGSDGEVLKDLAQLTISAIEHRRDDEISRLLHSLVVHTNDGVLIARPLRYTPHGAEILYANRAYARLVNREAERLIGQSTEILWGRRADRRTLDEVFSKLERGEPCRAELTLDRGNGDEIVAEMTAVPVEGASGTASHWVSIWRDISDRRALERSLLAAKDQAERADRAKSLFLANMSHELRTPINATIGFSEFMLQEPYGPLGSQRYRSYLGDVLQAGRHLLSLVEDLFDLSKIEGGRITLVAEPVDWAATVTAALKLLEPQLEATATNLRRQDPDKICTVVGDPRALKQVLTNLIGNAAKFSKPGGTINLDSRLARSGDLVVTIADRGAGMSEDEVERALQPFEQVDQCYSKTTPGMGIGLPLAKQLIELHDGRLMIESVKHEGTTVTITLPRLRVRAGASAASAGTAGSSEPFRT